MGSIASSGVQQLFCKIFESRDIGKLKWGIRSQNVQILDNLSVLNLMSNIVLLNFGSLMFHRYGFELSACLISMSSLGWDMSMSKPSKNVHS